MKKVLLKNILIGILHQNHLKKSGRLYETLGIKYFKKLYMSTLGKFISLVSGEKKVLNDYSTESLKNLEGFTRVCEGMHFIGNLIFTSCIALGLVNNDYEYAIEATFLNTIINIYPIMMQRYHRSKIDKILKHREKNPKKI